MRTFHNYRIFRESLREQREAGRYNPARKIAFRINNMEFTHVIGAGNSDTVDVFVEDDHILVLTYNKSLWYVGLEIFFGPNKMHDLFLQTDYEIRELLGPSELNLQPINMAKRMYNYWIEIK